MESIVASIAQYGILVVIAGLFIWEKINNSKTIDKVLSELKAASQTQTVTLQSLSAAVDSIRKAIDNSTTALGMVTQTLESQKALLERHDRRAEYMNGDIKAILENVRDK